MRRVAQATSCLGWQQVAWAAQQQEEELTNRLDIDKLWPNQQKLSVSRQTRSWVSIQFWFCSYFLYHF
jgi:hypothetical protein